MMFVKSVFWFVAGLLVAIKIRLIRPVRNYRLGRLPSHEIGHYATNVEVYLCEKDAEVNSHTKKAVDIWYRNPTARVSNHQLDKMWARTIRISDSPIIRYADAISRRLPGGTKNSIQHHDRDAYALFDKMPPHLSFTSDEILEGEKFLDSVRTHPGQKFICLAVRDSSYKREQFGDRDVAKDDYRNNNIDNYQKVAEQLAKDGYLVFRMGAKVERPFVADSPLVIDYASNGMRSEFLDIYLGANCELFISSVLGIDSIPEIFRRPRLLTNYIPVGNFGKYGPRDLIIPKQYWLKSESRFLRFSEIVASTNGLGSCTSSYEYETAGIELVENTPTEILQAACELLDRHQGSFEQSETDRQLIAKFWSNYYRLNPAPIKSAVSGQEPNIGIEFLRNNLHWVN
jgi:putative glycosyltransferase (TIGR04372 family)